MLLNVARALCADFDSDRDFVAPVHFAHKRLRFFVLTDPKSDLVERISRTTKGKEHWNLANIARYKCHTK